MYGRQEPEVEPGNGYGRPSEVTLRSQLRPYGSLVFAAETQTLQRYAPRLDETNYSRPRPVPGRDVHGFRVAQFAVSIINTSPQACVLTINTRKSTASSELHVARLPSSSWQNYLTSARIR
ncbi:hypothetical protein HPP92_004224 [Vanilla planifolia]|uniref:Uncharacterized protein n=1 Tax=Vanilla planifolia TaxID=51239 RepID=A0A835RRV7_VANPL|nr:hypothetical protein HPP92_004224 [Vanilla planifolia]